MPIAPFDQYLQNELTPAFFPERMLKASLRFAANQQLAVGTVVGICTNANADDVQTLTQASATGGTFTLTFLGGGVNQTTPPLAYNATAAAVQAALQALSNIGAGNVTCSGGALGTAGVVCTFGGTMANQPQPLMIVNNGGLTGSGAAVTAVHTTLGTANSAAEAYNADNTDGSQTPVGVLAVEIATDQNGNVCLGPSAGGQATNGFGAVRYVAPICIAGYFNTAGLVGLDTNAVSKLGRLIDGTVSSGVLVITGA